MHVAVGFMPAFKLPIMNTADYEKCARRIADALQLERGEKVLVKLDPRVFTGIVAPLQNLIRASGAHISGVILAEDTTATSPDELASLQKLFNDADVFIWLPELRQGSRPALAQALAEWLDSRRGRAVHFHWQSGSYPIGLVDLPPRDFIDRLYLAALDVAPADLERQHQKAMSVLRSGPVRVTTPEGTDITFEVGDRPFCSQVGDATRARMQSARTRIDRDIELPAGVLRVAPIETSANGTIFLPVWRPIATEGRNLFLRFINGHVAIQGVNADKIDQELSAAGGDARMFREFALGFNPALKVLPEAPFIGYYGYGSGVIRLSLGDNEEMGGANRGGGVYWNFIHNATVTVDGKTLVKGGLLT
jgi:aminopeptidase